MMTQADKLTARISQARGTIITISVVVDDSGDIVGFAVEKSVKLESFAKIVYASTPVFQLAKTESAKEVV